MASDLMALQRTIGNRAFVSALTRPAGALSVQRDVATEAATTLTDEERPSVGSIKAVMLHKKNAKKTGKTTWARVLKKVKEREGFWEGTKDHIMLGDDTTPPAGFHSKPGAGKRKAGDVNGEAVGDKNPANVGSSSPYKQWIRNSADGTYDHLKISTFYPDNWSEQKIRAAVLLENAGEEHQVEASFGLTSNDGTVYPATTLANPPQPG